MSTIVKPSAKASGFTLVELMVVVAIVSILMVIAMPAYIGYTTRSKVSEGMGFVAEAKTTVTEYYHSNGDMPVDNITAGLPPSTNYSRYDFVRSLSVGDDPIEGTITINFDLPGTEADNRELQLVPTTSGKYIIWTCQPAAGATGIARQFVPPNCRG